MRRKLRHRHPPPRRFGRSSAPVDVRRPFPLGPVGAVPRGGRQRSRFPDPSRGAHLRLPPLPRLFTTGRRPPRLRYVFGRQLVRRGLGVRDAERPPSRGAPSRRSGGRRPGGVWSGGVDGSVPPDFSGAVPGGAAPFPRDAGGRGGPGIRSRRSSVDRGPRGARTEPEHAASPRTGSEPLFAGGVRRGGGSPFRSVGAGGDGVGRGGGGMRRRQRRVGRERAARRRQSLPRSAGRESALPHGGRGGALGRRVRSARVVGTRRERTEGEHHRGAAHLVGL
mmetsp:Transcript_28173/g.64453  ORF Transcript_28173/g.64453 Transcript_28173/m.64453 type:complete len:279 (-) Transcript_28173:1491-2327(-)